MSAPAAMVIESATSTAAASPTTCNETSRSAVTSRFAFAVSVTLPPSSTALAEAVTVTTSACRATVTSANTLALLSPAESLAVTVMVAEPAAAGVSISMFPLLLAFTASALDVPA